MAQSRLAPAIGSVRAAPRRLRRLWPQARVARLLRRPQAAPPAVGSTWQRPPPGAIPEADTWAEPLPLPADGAAAADGASSSRRGPALPAFLRGLAGLSLVVGGLLFVAMVSLFILVFATMGS